MKARHNSSPRSPTRSHSPSMSPNKNGGGDIDSSPLQPTAARAHLPWFTESYFSSEPATAAARTIYITILASKGILIIIFLLSVLSIYWGALWQTPAHVHNLNNWVVVSPNTSQNFWMRDVNACNFWFAAFGLFFFLLQDFDGGEVGQFVSRAVVASGGAPTALSWGQVSTELFPNGVSDLEDAVIQEKAWTIIASASLVIV